MYRFAPPPKALTMVGVSANSVAAFSPSPAPKRLNYPSQTTISFPSLTLPSRRRSISLSTASAQSNGNGDSNGENNLDERQSSPSSPLLELKRWKDLLLSADPENIAAVGLTGLLAWASVQALFQLVFISFAIVLAALKYSFIAALLLFILITLL